ncbi:alpha/beta fold hydrolase [Veronia pacifica]|uniref:AB hydrolase-1 domain-containing protein n=1 Tax=Veronia pacifica TaxID=1080227 RepID=A0A1C3EQ29_9GAMM|nr:alpha/beta hydrolase [Veronia pacifica]ODA35351.1 hypothetical protein A8L45_04085 [Veronia pacifica]
MNSLVKHGIKLAAGLLLCGLSLSASASIGQWTFETNRSFEAMLAGLDEQSVNVGKDKWIYYVKQDSDNKADTCLVLIHGFTAEASHWFRFARNIDSAGCMIVPDLPGFGRSSYFPESDYAISQQVARLNHFLQHLDLAKRYHLVGSSMGGHIAALYTITHPEDVSSLTLVNAAGVITPTQTELDKGKGENSRPIFEPETQADYERTLDMTMSDPPWVPFWVRNYLGEEAIARTPRHRQIFRQVYRKDLLDNQLSNIFVPTLILWGDQDKLLSPDMADVFHNKIPGSEKVIFNNIGHLPFLEVPSKAADVIDLHISQR